MNFWILFGAIALAIVLFGAAALGYWFYLKTRNKKITYQAHIFEASGSMNPIIDENGKRIDSEELASLKPYAIDVIERLEKGKGLTIYRLVRHNKVVPEVKAENIVYWGKDKKIVYVIKDGDDFTLLRSGLDKSSRLIFQPIPYDRSNMLLNQMEIKRDKFRKEKDVFSAVTPWIVAMMVMIGMIGASYLFAQGWVKSSESLAAATEKMATAQQELSKDLIEVVRAIKGAGLTKGDFQKSLGLQDVNISSVTSVT